MGKWRVMEWRGQQSFFVTTYLRMTCNFCEAVMRTKKVSANRHFLYLNYHLISTAPGIPLVGGMS